MKASKRITIWIVFSLILQSILYLYLDQWYFSPETNIKVNNINSADNSVEIKPSITFDNKEKSISLSYDCTLTAYIENGKVKVVDTNSGKEKKLSFSEDVECLSYKWLPDSNIMMIAERVSYNGRKVIRFYSYDAEKQEKKDTDNYEGGHKVNYMASNSANDLVDFEISSSTGVLYAKITYSKGNSKIYRIDRNEKLTRVSTTTSNIGKVAVASDDDQLIYEDLYAGRIRTNYKNRNISINNSSKLSIVGTDDDNNFYIGFGKDKINKMYYGKLSENTSSWKSISLGKELSVSDIFVNRNGNVFTVDRNQGTVTNIKNNKQYKYSGSFIQINENYIAYKEKNKLKLEQIK